MANITPEMNAELKKAVISFNRKVKRLEKKGVSKSLLPPLTSMRELKSAYQNDNSGLESRLNQMAWFSSKGEVRENKKGVKGTDVAFAYHNAMNANNRQIIEQGYMASYGQKTKYKSRLNAYRRNARAKMKYLDKNSEELDARSLYRQKQNYSSPEALLKKNKTFRSNYYDKMYEYAQIGDVDNKNINKLRRKLDTIPDEDFYRVITTNPEFEDILDFLLDSPPKSGIKQATPTYSEKDVKDSFTNLLDNADNIIANSL